MEIFDIYKIAQEADLSGPISKKRLTRLLYDKINPITGGFFHDESWQGIGRIWDTFDKLGLDWHRTDAYYGSGHHDPTFPKTNKTWKFEIDFTNNRGRPDKIYGNIIAAGGGKIEDPFSRYDIIVVMGSSYRSTKTAEKWRDKLPGGLADSHKPEDYDAEQLSRGIKIELEHTNDPQIAKEITMDHLQEAEDFSDGNGGKYYTLLNEMEEEIEKKLENK